MKPIFFAALLLFLLSNCTNTENLSLRERLQSEIPISQTFQISNDKTETIIGKDGTRIIIPANSFVDSNGQEPKGQIQIELKEVFEKSDMILNGLSTTSDGRMLESFGMIYLKAYSANSELHIADDKSIKISIPNKKLGYDGELFYGAETDSLLNWEYAGIKEDTTEIIETAMPLSNGLLSIKRTTYKIVDGARIFESDTVFTVEYGDLTDDVAMEEVDIPVPSAYDFEIQNLGWINCDRFIEFDDKTSLTIELSEYSQPLVYLVFSDVNSVMDIYFDQHGKATVKNLPNEYPVSLVVIDNIKDNYMWARRDLILEKDQTVTLNMKKTTLNEIKEEIRMLDN